MQLKILGGLLFPEGNWRTVDLGKRGGGTGTERSGWKGGCSLDVLNEF